MASIHSIVRRHYKLTLFTRYLDGYEGQQVCRFCRYPRLPLNLCCRVLQARAEKLTEQVKTMSSRIAELEKLLAESQQNLRLATSTSTGASRILESANREPDAPPPTDDQMPNLVDAVGSLAINIHTEGGTKYYGSTSSSEVSASIGYIGRYYLTCEASIVFKHASTGTYIIIQRSLLFNHVCSRGMVLRASLNV